MAKKIILGLLTMLYPFAVYNGLIAYVLMGILLAGEYIIRIKTQKQVK